MISLYYEYIKAQISSGIYYECFYLKSRRLALGPINHVSNKVLIWLIIPR